MRTHPKIKAAMDRATTDDQRKAVEQADHADKVSRAYWGHGHKNVVTKKYVLDLAHAILLREGLTSVVGQDIDVFLLRFLRDYESASTGQEQ